MQPARWLVPVLFTLLASPSARAQDPQPKPGEAKPAPAPAIERLEAWPKPADKDQLLTDVERLIKARTEEMGKQAREALVVTGTPAVPFLIERYGREKDEGALARLEDVIVELVKAEQTRLLAKHFESKYTPERTIALWRAACFPDPGIREPAEAALARVTKLGEKADARERYVAALCATSTGSTKGLDVLYQETLKRWDKKGVELRSALEGVRGPEASKFALEKLDQADRKAKVAALRLLAGCGERSVSSRIKPYLDDQDNSIRVSAINALRGVVDGEKPLEELSAFEAIETAEKWKSRI